MFTWQVMSVSTGEHGAIVVATQPLSSEDDSHQIVIPPEAIGSRMALYGLSTPQEAFEAILREHGCLASPDITLPTTPTTAADFGGTNDAVTIEHADDTVQAQIDSAVADHQATIDTTAADRWNDPRYVALRDGGSPPMPPPDTLPPALPPPEQSPTAVAQSMADTITSAVNGVPDTAPVSQLRDAIANALAPYTSGGASA